MGKKAVKQYFHIIVLVASILLCLFTLIGLFGGDVAPAGHNVRVMSALVLPFLLICNVLALVYWVITRSWFAFIPVIALVSSINYIGTIFQFGGKPDSVTANLTIATYNVRAFNRDGSGVVAGDIINSLKKEGADIVCMQEFDNNMSGDHRGISAKIADVYPYTAIGKNLAILSRYPIKQNKDILFEMTNNASMWADIQVDEKHTIRVFNVHMETTGINRTLHHASKQQAAETAKDPENDPDEQPDLVINRDVASNVFENYILNCAIRSGQATTVANEKRNSPYPIVLCGDFNDVPYSYTYNTLLTNLKDGFREGGHGYGATYRGLKGIFRIDYIFHSENMESVDYYTIDQDYSDHNPVFSRLSVKQ